MLKAFENRTRGPVMKRSGRPWRRRMLESGVPGSRIQGPEPHGSKELGVNGKGRRTFGVQRAWGTQNPCILGYLWALIQSGFLLRGEGGIVE